MLRCSFELQPHWHIGGAFAISLWRRKDPAPELLVLFGDRRLDRHFAALPLEEAPAAVGVAAIEVSLLQTGGAWLPFTFHDSAALEWEWWGGGHTEGHAQRAKVPPFPPNACVCVCVPAQPISNTLHLPPPWLLSSRPNLKEEKKRNFRQVFMQNFESVADSPSMLGSLVQFQDIVGTFCVVCNAPNADPEFVDSLVRVREKGVRVVCLCCLCCSSCCSCHLTR